MKRTVLSLLLAAGVSSALSGCFALAAGGVAGGVLVATDRRSSGAYVDDRDSQGVAPDWRQIAFGSRHNHQLTVPYC
jgi:osmotically-inducible protein OsmY